MDRTQLSHVELEQHYRAKFPEGLPDYVEGYLASLRGPVPYDDEVHRSDLIAAAEEAGEIGWRSDEGRDVRWDDLLQEWEEHHGVDLGTEDDSAPIRAFKRAYRKAWKESNE